MIEQPIRNYLNSLAGLRAGMSRPVHAYFGAEDLVSDRGTVWSPTESCALTAEENKTLFRAVDAVRQRFEIKQCFFNSQMLVVYDDTNQLRYWEGWAQGRAVIPLHHGWVSLNGKLIDLTWRLEKPRTKGRLRNRVLGEIPEDWVYMGIPITREVIIEEMFRTGCLQGLLFDPKLYWYQRPRLGEPPIPFSMDDR